MNRRSLLSAAIAAPAAAVVGMPELPTAVPATFKGAGAASELAGLPMVLGRMYVARVGRLHYSEHENLVTWATAKFDHRALAERRRLESRAEYDNWPGHA